jgi:hypothetical protein
VDDILLLYSTARQGARGVDVERRSNPVAAAAVARWELMGAGAGAGEYYDYRRAIYGDITHKAILVDDAGTLLAPTELPHRAASCPVPSPPAALSPPLLHRTLPPLSS